MFWDLNKLTLQECQYIVLYLPISPIVPGGGTAVTGFEVVLAPAIGSLGHTLVPSEYPGRGISLQTHGSVDPYLYHSGMAHLYGHLNTGPS